MFALKALALTKIVTDFFTRENDLTNNDNELIRGRALLLYLDPTPSQTTTESSQTRYHRRLAICRGASSYELNTAHARYNSEKII